MKVTAATVVAAATLAASGVIAQNTTAPATNGTSYSAGLVAALNAANLTSLATVLGVFPDLATTLENGGNFTVFGPSNEALAPLLANAGSANLTEVQQLLMYHVAPGTLRESALGSGMNHTIAPSTLMAPLLGMNQTQPLVLSLGTDGRPRVRTASQNVTVLGNATYQNLLVHAIDQVLQPPLNLTATVAAANLTLLSGALGAVSADLPAMLSMTPRLTIFAPTDAAFGNISAILPTLNATQIATVLGNHIINGTVVYSNEITANTTAISSVGETISFSMMNGTVMVMSGNMSMARIVRADIPIENGVVHLIDQVLTNTMANPQAAASAASSYAVEATASPSATAGVAGAAAGTKTGAGYKSTFVGASTVAAALVGAAFAFLA